MRIAVIGGGPAGMMSAITASKNGAEVVLYERNEKLGKKLYITGKGRCNVTNYCSAKEFVNNVVTNAKFMYGAINKFSPEDTINFVESNGTKTKVERGNRVFPLSDKASDITKAFEKALKNSGVKVVLNAQVIDITVNYSKLCQLFDVSLTNMPDIVPFDKVIIATGGISYPSTGSTGDGYAFAEKYGHKIVQAKPALCKVLCSDTKTLMGLSLKNVTFTAFDGNGKQLYSEFGEMLFTDDGVSGPIVLSASSIITKDVNKCKYVGIDLKPALDEKTLDLRVQRDFAEKCNKDFSHALEDLLPSRLAEYVIKRSNINPNKKVNQVTAEERGKIVSLLKCLTFKFVGLDDVSYGIVTSGGVDVSCVNPSTMESKVVKGLYFAGEVLDVDAFTGGFNIQIALSTGYVAGQSASQTE